MTNESRPPDKPRWDELAEPKKPPVSIPLPFEKAVEGLVRVKPEPAKKKAGKAKPKK